VNNIDKQRVSAVRKLEELGYKFAGEWLHRVNDASVAVVVPAVTDPMHVLLVQRADMLEGCIEGSEEERELAAITDAIEAYEAKRWPEGKVPGGKG